MNKLQQFWQVITENGVDEQALGREVVKVRLLNQLIVIAFSVSCINVPIYLIFGDPTGLIYSNVGNVILEGTCIYLAYQKRHKEARFFAVFLFSTLEAVHVIAHGLNLGNVFTTLGIMSFILYEGHRRTQIVAIFYICVLFITSKLYVLENFDNTFKAHNYNDLLFFPMVLAALALMLFMYQKEMRKYEKRQNELIDTLEDKNKVLSEINDELEQFTYIASHDLKTPLRTVNSYLHLTEKFLNAEQYQCAKENLQLAQKGTKEMHTLIRDILEYKSINRGEEAFEKVDLNEIITNVLIHLKSIIEEKKGTIKYQVLPSVNIRKSDFIVLFQKVIENGLKYNTSENPTVWIENEITKDAIIITFRDNGIGIAPEFHDKIFHFFKRLHTQEKHEGTGIGLGLSQKIIHSYGGTISLKSKVGEGSEFIIILPLKMRSTLDT